jgi:DNA-binding NarL/FixJ family response regulator
VEHEPAGSDQIGVLVVDDQPPFRKVAATVVTLVPGWSVVAEADTGEEAVTSALENRPDVVLMDINLPGINGIEATRRILSERPDTVVLLVSTYEEADLPPDALTCGARAYVRKEDLTPRVLRGLLEG